ncbi:2'-5'-oligoadenylate synthase 1 isoform X2 [Eptesicus fuscus]|uniref:2'-5'-oligoadenylate synthase 1 isoform X2 n=1 Tax=Eptesicus fuscus TaxID=29078 RepID=UPI0024044008|nr:2'-5'-oligoadenylate synthase 1 isoform X2 [Eptesicus fuscus]
MSLENIPATDLDGFIESHLLPDTAFRRQVKEAIDTICSFLKERCFREGEGEVRVSKVVKCKEKLESSLPPQYALELLTVYAWERAGRQTDFITAQGFQTVLELVVNHRQLCIYWTQYYDISHPVIGPYLRRQLQKPRPVILDPADPTGNVGGGHQRGWVLLAREARAWMKYQCFRKGDGSPVGSWNIQA